ncbi:MAG: hypothetical protein NZ578_04265 [Candidatus Binatia bacterium]|nr:hypothetical protein [Candidatus Binatia bacterium]
MSGGRSFTSVVAMVCVLVQPGCFFSGGVSTFRKATAASGSGFIRATERNGQWDHHGPPPRVGEITERPIYREVERARVVSFAYAGDTYHLTNPYPSGRYRITAIRELGAVVENGATVHYYAVEFDPAHGG